MWCSSFARHALFQTTTPDSAVEKQAQKHIFYKDPNIIWVMEQLIVAGTCPAVTL